MGDNVVGKTHRGTINLKEGYIDTRDSKLIGGSFVIDMGTIKDNDGSEMLVKHLSGQDFFDAAAYPESKLEITSVEPDSSRKGYYVAKADLTIKNKTNPISFDIFLGENDKAITAKAKLSIDRTLWDVRYGSGKFFQGLGDKMIKDEIKYDVNLITE
jgi:polyisoprenoid-binding protein YceI